MPIDNNKTPITINNNIKATITHYNSSIIKKYSKKIKNIICTKYKIP